MIAYSYQQLLELLPHFNKRPNICCDCGEEKPIGEFYLRKSGRSKGLRTGRCILCARKAAIKWKHDNRERFNANRSRRRKEIREAKRGSKPL